ncbi:hypothetical protein [Streptomyces poriticola]|uniref:hypothetical protein n=1 Tax=Streptomyces poriticola TaxID=3120506 RepID=UPI002FCE509F
MTWSAALPDAAVRVLRTAAGRRALQFVLLVGAVVALGLCCAERAEAADGRATGATGATGVASVTSSTGATVAEQAVRILSGSHSVSGSDSVGRSSRGGEERTRARERWARPVVDPAEPLREAAVAPLGQPVPAAGLDRSDGAGRSDGVGRSDRVTRPDAPSAAALPGLQDILALSEPAKRVGESGVLPGSSGGDALLPGAGEHPHPLLPRLPDLPTLPGFPDLPALPDAERIPAVPLPAPAGPTAPTPEPVTSPATGDEGSDVARIAADGDRAPGSTPQTAGRQAAGAGGAVYGPRFAGHGRHGDQRGDGGHSTDGRGLTHPAPVRHAPSGDPDGELGHRSAADNGTPRHGDAHAVTLHHRVPLLLVPGAVVRADAAETKDRYRDIPVSPA